MVATVGSIEVLLKLVGAEKYATDFRSSATTTEQGARRIDLAMRNTSKSTEGLGHSLAALTRGNSAVNSLALSSLRASTSVGALTRSFTALGAAIGGIGGALAVKTVTDYADAYTNVQNKLATVISGQKERVAVERELFDIAQRSRSSFADTAQIYQRLSLASRSLGVSQRDVLKVVETTQKALVTGGATTAEAGSIATQLSQALGSGRLQGDELRSIGENSTILIQAIAKEFGVAVGELKALGSEGKLTSDRVFRAIINAGAEVEEAFARTTPTIAAGIQQVDNALLRYIGQTDKTLGASEKIAGGLKYVADNLKSIGDAAQYAVALVGANIFSRLLTNAATSAVAPIAKIRADSRRAIEEAKSAQEASQTALSRARQALTDIERGATRDRLGYADRAITRQAERATIDAARTPLGTAEYLAAARRRDDLIAQQNDSANRNIKAAAAAATAEIQKQTAALGAANAAMLTAQRSASTLAGALASVGAIGRNAFAGLVAALGGGLNAALTGVGVALIAYSLYQARAAEQARLYKEALDTVPDALQRLTVAQEAANAALGNDAGLRAARANANAQLGTIEEGIVNQSSQIIAGLSNLINSSAIGRPEVKGLQALYKELNNTREGGVLAKESLNSLIAALESLSGRSPNLAKAISEVLGLARALQSATGQATALRIALAGGYDDPRDLIAKASAARQASIARDAVARIDQMVGPVGEAAVPKIVTDQIAAQYRDQAGKESRFNFEKRVQDRLDENRGIFTQDQVRAQIRAEDAIKESQKRGGGSRKSPEERAAETLSKKLTELGQDAAVAGLSDLDQKTVRFAQSAKVAAGNVDEFVKALQSGDLSKIPPEMQKIREEIEKLEATKFARGQLDELFPARKMEQQIRQLSIAAKSMPEVAANFDALAQKIRVANAPDWAKDASSAISDFALSAITDFKNIGEAADQLWKALLKVALQATILKPLENGLTSMFSGGGFNFSSLFGSLGGSSIGLTPGSGGLYSDGGYTGPGGKNQPRGIVHAGEVVWSQDDVRRAGGVAVVEGMRRGIAGYANGGPVSSGEFAAAIDWGSRRQSAVASAKVDRALDRVASSSSGGMKVVINNTASNQVQASAERGPDGDISVVIKSIEGDIANRFTRGQGSLSTAFGARQAGRQLRG